MEVKCINNQNVEGTLKINKLYPVLEEKEDQFIIEVKKGTRATYNKNRFERVE